MRSETSVGVEAFEYPVSAMAQPSIWKDIPEIGSSGTSPHEESGNEYLNPDSDSRRALSASATELAARSFEEGREQGIREARDMAANEQRNLSQEADKKRVEQAAQLAGRFADDRDRFFHDVEADLVRLALAIAARILRREAQMDPLFLLGAVRVALGNLATTMQVRIRIPAAESGLWTETLEHIPNLRVKPVVIPDDSMQLGDCMVETEMGSVDLGLRAQLRQIETSLMDDPASTRAGTSVCPGPPEHEAGA